MNRETSSQGLRWATAHAPPQEGAPWYPKDDDGGLAALSSLDRGVAG